MERLGIVVFESHQHVHFTPPHILHRLDNESYFIDEEFEPTTFILYKNKNEYTYHNYFKRHYLFINKILLFFLLKKIFEFRIKERNGRNVRHRTDSERLSKYESYENSNRQRLVSNMSL